MPSFLSRRTLKKPEKEKRQNPFLKWLGRFFMGLGVLMFISIIMSMITLMSIFSGGEQAEMKPLPKEFVLYHDMDMNLANKPQPLSLVAELTGAPIPTTLRNFSDSLDAAKQDDRVTHFVMRIHDGGYSMAQIHAMRRMINDFRETSGKETIIIADNFGNMSSGLGEYWLATAFDKIWLEPLGVVSLTGIHAETPYFADTLDKIGVEFQMERRKDYKTGAEPYIQSQMSEEGRQSLDAILSTVMDNITDDIAEARDIDSGRLRQLINQSPLLEVEALEAGLIDRVDDTFALNDYITGKEEDAQNEDDDIEPTFISINRYAADFKNQNKIPYKQAGIAVISVEGMILDEPLMQQSDLGRVLTPSPQIAEAVSIRNKIMSITKDKQTKVIILQVNSPGGSPAASEIIRNAVVKAKEEGKYIIVSMADTAASGGYWVTVNADEIIASPYTITGSIGVYGGKPNLSALWDKIGLNWETLSYGQNASMWSLNEPYSDSERARLNAMMDHIYDAFTTRVAEGRSMDMTDVENVAKGRAWIGTDALSNGLIDQMGDFETALRQAAIHMGYEADQWRDLTLYYVMDKQDPLEELKALIGLPIGIKLPDMPYSILQNFFLQINVLNPFLEIKL